MPRDVTILGAGVLGLSTAYRLCQDHNFKITVIAKSFPTDPSKDYTSQYAGANWRSVCANDDHRMIAWERETLLYFREFSKSYPNLVNCCYGVDYFDPRQADTNDARIIRALESEDGEKVDLPWFHEICDEFEVFDTAKLPPGATYGIKFDTVTINAPEYVKWLLGQCQLANVTFVTREVEHLEDVPGEILINCLGLGAASIFQDNKLYPTRGQTVLVENTTNLTDTLSRVGPDFLSYLIPRPGDGGLIIGGCQQPNNWSREVDEDLAATMLGWAATLYPGVFPEDHTFQVIKHNVGLRPSRQEGARVELEILNSRPIVHGYGIGGWGFQSSWGIAGNLIDLLRKACVALESKGV